MAALSEDLQRIVDEGHFKLGRYQLDLSPPDPTHDYVGAIKPNRFLSGLAKAAQTTKNVLNKVEVGFRPTNSFIKLGELVPGEAPRILDDAAHGFMPVHGRGMTTRLDPGVLDAVDFVGLPAGLAYGATRAGTRKAASEISRVANRAMDTPVDQSRRKFNKGLAGAVATAAVGVPVAKKVATTAAKEVVTRPSAAALLQKSTDDAFRKLVGQALRRNADFPMKWKDAVDSLVGPADSTLRSYTWKELASPSGRTPHINALYRQGQIDKLQKLIDGIPEGEDVQKLFDNALIRLRGSAPDGGDDLAGVLKLGRGHIGSAHRTKEQWQRNKLLRSTHTDSELLELLKDVPREDIDRWILTGKRPAGVTDKMVRSMDEFHVMENSDLFYGDIESIIGGDSFVHSIDFDPEQVVIDAIINADPVPF